MNSFLVALRGILDSIKKRLTSVRIAVKKAASLLWQKLLTPFFFAMFTYILLPVGKCIKWFAKYLLFIPVKFICITVYKLFYHIFYRPLRFIAVNILKPFFSMIARIIGKICVFIYKYILCLLIFHPVYFIFKNIRIAVKFIAKILYKYLIHPLFRAVEFIFRGIFMFLRFIISNIYYGIKIILQFIYYAVLIKILRLLSIIFTAVGRFVLKFILKPIYFLLRIIYLAFEKLFIFIFNIFKFFFNAVMRLIELIFEYIIVPVCKFIGMVVKHIFDLLIYLCKGIEKVFKLIFESIAVFFTVIICSFVFFLYAALCYPFRILFKESPAVRAMNIAPLKKASLNFLYIFQKISEDNKAHLDKTKETKPDLASFVKLKNIAVFTPTVFWLTVLYPVNFLITAKRGQ